MKRELKIFLKRNRVQLIIVLICILITVKQMNAPFILPYNVVTSFLFERVASETAGGEILDLLSDLGFAYYSSLIFYYVVDYFPTRKKENKALRAVADHLSQLTIYIEKLFATLLFVSGKGTKIEDLKNDNRILELCQLELDNQERRCTWEIINRKTGEITEACQGGTLCPFNCVKKTAEAILKEINSIYAHANMGELEEEIKEFLCDLSENRYITNASRLNGTALDAGARSLIVNCNHYDLLALIGIRLAIGKLPIEQYQCTMRETTEQELQEIEKAYEDLKKRMPAAVAAYEKTKEALENDNT